MVQSLYNELALVREDGRVLEPPTEDCLDALSDILIKHDLQEHLGIALVHRHFHLDNDEQLVELKTPDNTDLVVSVFKNGHADPQVVETRHLVLPNDPVIIPTTYLIRKRELIPFEYICTEKTEASRIAIEVISHVTDEFCMEWAQVLEDFTSQGKFGVGFLNGDGQHRVEHLFFDERISIYTYPGKEHDPAQYVQTLWAANKIDRMRGSKSCGRC